MTAAHPPYPHEHEHEHEVDAMSVSLGLFVGRATRKGVRYDTQRAH